MYGDEAELSIGFDSNPESSVVLHTKNGNENCAYDCRNGFFTKQFLYATKLIIPCTNKMQLYINPVHMLAVTALCFVLPSLYAMGVPLSLTDRIVFASEVHLFLESSAAVLAFVVAALALAHYSIRRDALILLFSLSILFSGVFDLFHAIESSRLTTLQFSDDIERIRNGSTTERQFSDVTLLRFSQWTWSASRFFSSLTLCLATAYISYNRRNLEKLQATPSGNRRILRNGCIVAIVMLLVVLSLLIVFVVNSAPSAPSDRNNPIRGSSETAPLLFYTLAFCFTYIYHAYHGSPFTYSLLLRSVPDSLIQWFMMFGSENVFDAYFNIAHTTKLLAVVLSFGGLIADVYVVHRQRLQELKESLHQRATLQMRSEMGWNEARTKSAFLANMSHEIRTPMNGVIGMLNVIQNAEIPVELRKDIDVCERSAQALMNVLNDVLLYSKADSGQLVASNKPFSVLTQVEDVVQILYPLALKKSIGMISDVSVDVPSIVVGDCGRLRQVLMNLIGNAIKFTDHGHVHVRAFSVADNDDNDIDDDNDKNSVVCIRFEIEDSGIGIRSSDMTRLFKPFSQVDDGSRRQYEGTGLGLTIVKQLVALMGGKIYVRSKIGVGSVFSFTIRCAPVPKDMTLLPAPDYDIELLSGKKALIIDDNSVNRLVVQRLLKHYKMDVIEASSGKAGIEMLKKEALMNKPFDAVLLDYHMPNMNGADVARSINNSTLKEVRRVPILLVSSYTAHTLVKENLVDDAIDKPIRRETLLKSLCKIFQGHPRRTSTVNETKQSFDSTGNCKQGPVQHKVPMILSKPTRILIVDDLFINAFVLKKVLATLGYVNCDTADSGIEALEKLFPNDDRRDIAAYEIVFMDIHMPIMDGLQTSRAIRQRHSTKAPLFIVAVTADNTPETTKQCNAVPMDGIIYKPVTQAILKDVIDKLFARDNIISMTTLVQEKPCKKPNCNNSKGSVEMSKGSDEISGKNSGMSQENKRSKHKIRRKRQQLRKILPAFPDTAEIQKKSDENNHNITKVVKKKQKNEIKLLVLADDDSVNSLIIEKMLTQIGNGWSIETYSSGDAALKRLVDENIECPLVALLDVNMPPGIGGIEIAQHMAQKDHLVEQIYIVLISAEVDAAAISSQAHRTARKPLSESELLSILEAAQKHRATFDTKNMHSTLAQTNQKEATKSEPPIDFENSTVWSAFRDDRAQLAMLINEFVNSTSTRLTQLSEKAALLSETEVRAETHAVRGSAAAFGATNLVELLRQVSAAAQEADWSRCKRLIDINVLQEWTSVTRQLQRQIESK